MPEFTYKARTKTGEFKTGNLTSSDRRSATSQLQRMGLVPILISEGAAIAAPNGKNNKKKKPSKKTTQKASKPKSNKRGNVEKQGKARMKLRETLLFTRELADLIASGMMLEMALANMKRRDEDNIRGIIITELHDQIVQGTALSDALTRRPETFPNFYVSMVRAGETSGQIVEALRNLVNYYERTLEARDKVTMALVYPAFILIIGMVTIIFCMIYVIPTFTEIFESVNIALPLPTRILIGASDVLIKYGWILGIGFTIMILSFRSWLKSDAGRFAWHGIILRLPIASGVIKANAFSNFARTLGGLLKNGVPVLNALKISEETMGNQVISKEVSEARERVTDGSSISKPLAESGVFPPLFTDMLAVGEASGNLSRSLGHIAERYDDDLERNIKVLTTAIEPILILVMAVLVGFVALSMLSAVFKMTSGLG